MPYTEEETYIHIGTAYGAGVQTMMMVMAMTMMMMMTNIDNETFCKENPIVHFIIQCIRIYHTIDPNASIIDCAAAAASGGNVSETKYYRV